MNRAEKHNALQRLESAFWETQGRLEWIRDNVHNAADDGELGQDAAIDVSDHADEAVEALFGPLAIVHRASTGVELEAVFAKEAEHPIDLDPPPENGVRETIGAEIHAVLAFLSGTAPMLLKDARGPDSGFSLEDLDQLDHDLLDAAESVEAALLIIDPTFATRGLEAAADPDERIALASHQELVEIRGETVRRTNDFETALSEAHRKLQALSSSRSKIAASLLVQLSRLEPSAAHAVTHALVVDAGLSIEEARALVGHHLRFENR